MNSTVFRKAFLKVGEWWGLSNSINNIVALPIFNTYLNEPSSAIKRYTVFFYLLVMK